MYSRQVLAQFQNTQHVGELPEADACVRLENPACGDILQLSIKVAEGRVVEAKFRARGCVAAIACGSQLVTMILDQPLAAVRSLTREELLESLGDLPAASQHASHLAMDVLRRAMAGLG
jgi:nitrogen fixation NifU-like protein